MMEEAKRDHRKLGRELDLFAFSDLVGPVFRYSLQEDTCFAERWRILFGPYETVWI